MFPEKKLRKFGSFKRFFAVKYWFLMRISLLLGDRGRLNGEQNFFFASGAGWWFQTWPRWSIRIGFLLLKLVSGAWDGLPGRS